MQQWVIAGIKYLDEGSVYSDSMGQYPLKARYIKRIVNLYTGELIEITDLQTKKRNRNNALNMFFGEYANFHKKAEISILSLVVDASKYDTIATFNASFNKKLKRKGIKRLGYVWVRDIGDFKFEKHFHVLIATSSISEAMFHSLFQKNKDNKYKVQFLKTKYGMKNYIKAKELYAALKQRSYGRSREFLSHK
jgi:hypothetical protein